MKSVNDFGFRRLNCGIQRTSGFSLIEILLVFALVAIGLAVTVVNFDVFETSGRSEPPEKIALGAIREARMAAIVAQEWTYLTWDAEKRSFDISTLAGGTIQSFPVERGVDAAADNLEVIFETIPSAFNGRTPFNFRQNNTSTLERVAFSPQRVSNPFILKVNDGDIAFEQRIDPFSSMPIAEEETGN